MPDPTPLSLIQLSAVLLELSGDLDKAEVLQQRLPPWLLTAKPELLERLEQVHQMAGLHEPKVSAILQRIKALDQFCADELSQGLKQRFGVTLDVRRDHLWLPWERLKVESSSFPMLTPKVVVETRSLLQTAMQNCSEAEAGGTRFPEGSAVRRGDTDEVVDELSASAFAAYCRKLDLGQRYQSHLASVLNQALPVGDGVVHNPDASEIKQLKVHDMAADVYIAYLRGDIGEPAFKLLLGLTRQGVQLSKAGLSALKYGYKPLLCHGLDVHDTCLWGIVVFAQEAIDRYPRSRCIVYMPGEPYRPIFEYPSFADFQTYLTSKLQAKSYAEFFGRYLDEESRSDFFTRFASGKSLGTIKPLAIDTGLFQFFFNSYVGKLQKDSRVLAVPTADFDQTVREQRYESYLSAGLNLLNLAGFFVPVVGQLMMGVAVGQMLGEIYEGVQDWRHDDRSGALSHLRNVVESVASLAAFAVGGKVVGAVRRAASEHLEFFDDFEAVQSADGQRRLWRSSLRPYTQRAVMGEADGQGFYWRGGQPWIKIDARSYRLRYDPASAQWRVQHPSRAEAFSPPVVHNGAGGWRPVHERVDEWSSSLYGLRRLDPRLEDLDAAALEQIRQANDVQLSDVQHWARDNLKLPASVQDSVQRHALDQKIGGLIWALENRKPFTPEHIAVQLEALPLMPGWPRGRYLEVLDGGGDAVAKYPSNAVTDSELSVAVTHDQVHEGEVLVAAAEGLYPAELAKLLAAAPKVAGETNAEALARCLAETLNADRKPLFDRLYTLYDQPVGAEQAQLKASVPGLPAKVAGELIDNASSLDRIHLRDTRRVPLALREAARKALARRPRSTPAAAPVPACVLADPPQPSTPTGAIRGLIRKVRALYPFFTEQQASELIMGLGVDDFARAAAVRRREQQLVKLDAVLKAWTEHDADMKKLPGLLDDLRKSRRQVAARIRSCWRHQTHLPNAARASVYALSLDQMRVGKLPALPAGIDFGHVQYLSLKNMALDNDAAYFLKAFKGLHTLELDNNQLTWLPETLSHMPSLERLSLAQNRLNLTDVTTRKLQAMTGLRALDLSSNPLGETPSVKQMEHLQSLNLRDTRAKELPEGLLTRLHLEDANLRENDIVELPSELFTAPVAVTEKINLRLNPVSAQSRQDLDEYRRRTGVGMGLQEDNIAVLSELRSRQAWLEGETADVYLKRQATWEALKDDWQSADFFAVLRQLVSGAEYRQVRHDLIRRVWAVIDAAAEDGELRGLLFAVARGEPNCMDAAAYSFSEMEVTVLLNKAMKEAGISRPSVATLLKLGRGLFRLEQLDSISDVFSQRKNIADELAVRLVYRSGLAKTLELPGQPESITYRHVGGVTQEDLAEALGQVNTREMTLDLAHFLARQGFWLTYLKQQFSAEFSSVRQIHTTRMQALDVDSSTYENAVNQLQTDYASAREQLVERLTRTALEDADKPPAVQCVP